MRLKIKDIRKGVKENTAFLNQNVTLKGWIRTVRNQKTFTFIELNDGSTLSNFQIIADANLPGYQELLPRLTTGAAISASGIVVESPGKEQSVEMHATGIAIIGDCSADTYPLQKKRHTFEFLRTIGHLRPRTNTIGAVARVRSALAFATHEFFQNKGFIHVQTPIITGSDCEGAGEMFRLTTLNPDKPPKTPEGKVDFSQDFFGKPAYLTVSGQLNGEIYACSHGDIYTFGPTFRAENSNTARHLAEFWMIEPEMAFADLNDDMNNAEEYIKYVLNYALKHCMEDLEFFNEFISKKLLERLAHVVETPFERATYSYAIRILERSDQKFEFPVKWGMDLQSEHERYLAEEFFNKPVILTDYPKTIKPFYMRLNEDHSTVANMDILVPKIGEIVGGSQREERYDLLAERLKESGLSEEDYWWYLELRKYGTVPHAGYGVGFERLIQFVTGIENIRDAIAFPRYPGKAEF